MLDRQDGHGATVMASIRNSAAKPSVQKEAATAENIIVMIETLDRGFLAASARPAMLLIGYPGDPRRCRIVGLDLKAEWTEDGGGWSEILDKGMMIALRRKTNWREVEVGLGTSDATCPVAPVETRTRIAKRARGSLFRRITGHGKTDGSGRLNDREVAQLVRGRDGGRCSRRSVRLTARHSSLATRFVLASPLQRMSTGVRFSSNSEIPSRK